MYVYNTAHNSQHTSCNCLWIVCAGGAWESHILNRVLFSLGKDTHRGSPEDHMLGEITKGCVIPRSGWVFSHGSSFHGVPRAANPQ